MVKLNKKPSQKTETSSVQSEGFKNPRFIKKLRDVILNYRDANLFFH
jgi:hypothetical protein